MTLGRPCSLPLLADLDLFLGLCCLPQRGAGGAKATQPMLLH